MRVMLIPAPGQRLEQPVESTGRIGPAGRHQQRGLVLAARPERLLADDEEARGVVLAVLDVGDEDLEAVDFRRDLPRDRRRALLVAGATGCLRIARNRNALHLREVLVEPAAALRQRLGMRAQPFDVLECAHAPHEVLVHAQLHLTADAERRTDEAVQGMGDRALGGVLIGTTPKSALPASLEHLGDRRHREAAHGMPELLEHRLLRERALGPR